MAGLFLPFNFNSGQTLTVTAGNSTIPVGKYAFLSCHCKEDETLIIDGTEAQSAGPTVTAEAIRASGASDSDSFTVPNDGVSYFEGSGMSDYTNAGQVNVDGFSLVVSGTVDSNVIKAGPGQTVQVFHGAGGTGNTSVAGYIIKNGGHTVQNYWLSEGTILTGTATKTITLFDIT